MPFGERSLKQQPKEKDAKTPAHGAPVEITEDMEENDILKAMGLPAGFDTTKGKPVSDANHHGARLKSKRQYRQYMNRRGGFNRPLDPSL